MRILLLLLATSVLLAACSRPEPLRIAIHPWIGYESFYLAEDFGWLPDDARLVKLNSLGDSVAALIADQADAAALTLDEMLLARSRGIDLTAVLVFNVSAGADALLVRPAIETLEQLAGKRIGVENSALGPLVLSHALEQVGLVFDDVTVVDVSPDRQLLAWQQDRVDAVVTYSPAKEDLLEIGAKVLFDSRQMPGVIVDVLAVRSDRLDHPSLKPLLLAHFRALNHQLQNYEDTLYRTAARRDQQPSSIRLALSGIALPGLEQNHLYLRENGELQQSAERVQQLMLERELLNKARILDGVISARYLPAPGGIDP